MSGDEAITDFFGVGDRTALACVDPPTTGGVLAALTSLGFKPHVIEAADVAIERLRYTQYHCIVIEETLAGCSLRSNAVLNHLTQLAMALRRNSFVCLIGASFKTLDAMQAFAASVHLVVNPIDLPSLGAILNRGLSEFDLLYRVYKDRRANE